MNDLVPILFAAVVGFAHAFEADHLLAVSSIVTKRDSIWKALKDGIAWGLGHTSTIFVVGAAIIVFKVAIREDTFRILEASVGGMLIVLGIFRMYFLFKTGHPNHAHFHLEDLYFWKKKNAGAPLAAPYRFQQNPLENSDLNFKLAPEKENHHLAYGVGLVHGLAGSGTLVVLVMSQIPGPGLSMLYLLIFGIGSIAGMLLASTVFSLPFSKKIGASKALQIGLTLFSSILCIGYGIRVILENLAA